MYAPTLWKVHTVLVMESKLTKLSGATVQLVTHDGAIAATSEVLVQCTLITLWLAELAWRI